MHICFVFLIWTLASIQKYTYKKYLLNYSIKIYESQVKKYLFSEESNNEKLLNEEDKRRSSEVKRQDKWLKMIQGWKKLNGTEKVERKIIRI